MLKHTSLTSHGVLPVTIILGTRKPGAFLVLFQTPGQSEVKLSIGWWPVCRTKHLASFQAVLSHSISIHFFASSKQTTASKFQRKTAVMADSGSFLQFMTKARVWLWVGMNFPICFVAWTELIARKLHICAHIWAMQRNTSWICNLAS